MPEGAAARRPSDGLPLRFGQGWLFGPSAPPRHEFLDVLQHDHAWQRTTVAHFTTTRRERAIFFDRGLPPLASLLEVLRSGDAQ